MKGDNQVSSRDGTSLAFWRQGSGPALLLVHGGLCDHLAWYYVVPLLARHFAVWSYDRRGHGCSGDTPPHSVEEEVEDVQTMLDAIGEPAHLLGHSAGAILALGAALRTERLRSLILYEPPFVVEGARQRPGPEILCEMERLLAVGDADGALRIAIRETVSLTDAEIDRMQQAPGWEHLRESARAIPNDWRIWEEPLVPERLRDLRTRTLLLVGSASTEWMRAGTRTVLEALPDATLVELPDQAHSAMIASPKLFADLVVRFACGLGQTT